MPTPDAVSRRSDDLVALPPGLPASWRVRRPDLRDVDRLLRLCRDCDLAVSGTVDLSREEVESDMTASSADPRRNQLVVLDGDAGDQGDGSADAQDGPRALAWAWVDDLARGRTMLDVFVAPDLPAQQQEALGSWAWDWTVARGREVGAERGLAENLLDLGTLEGDERSARWLRDRGFEPVRTFYRMTRPVPTPGEVPEPAPGVRVRPLRDPGEGRDEDLRTAYDVAEAAFADHWNNHPRTYEEWWASHEDGSGLDLGLWRLAEVDGRVAGLLVGTRQSESEGAAYVRTVATLREARGRGVATTLLWAAFAQAAAEGHERVTLGVDGDNLTGATRLYESVGMTRDLAMTAWHRTVVTGAV